MLESLHSEVRPRAETTIRRTAPRARSRPRGRPNRTGGENPGQRPGFGERRIHRIVAPIRLGSSYGTATTVRLGTRETCPRAAGRGAGALRHTPGTGRRWDVSRRAICPQRRRLGRDWFPEPAAIPRWIEPATLGSSGRRTGHQTGLGGSNRCLGRPPATFERRDPFRIIFALFAPPH